MRKSPVRVAVMSESLIVREGLVSLLGQLGDRAVVVDLDPSDACRGHVDVVIFDLGAAPGPAGYPEVRRLAGLGLPMVALVYDATGGRAVDGSGGQLISLTVTAEELGEVLDRMAPCVDHTHQPRQSAGDSGLPAGLTQRELAVITLIGAGLSNKQIAAQLFVSCNTIKTYIRTAYRKLGVQSRIHAALWAVEHGLVAQPVRENPVRVVLDPVPTPTDPITAV